MKDLALAYILASVHTSCKAMVTKTSCPAESRKLLKKMFVASREASLDSMLCQLESTGLKKGEKIVEHNKKLLELVSELQNANNLCQELNRSAFC